MNITNRPDKVNPKKLRFPRWLTPFYFGVLIPLALIFVPWACSLLSPHYGWTSGRPRVWQFLGLLLVGAGIACIIWIIILHYREAPEGWEFERTPKYLVRGGPYAFSRNPSFLSVQGIALGWAIFYGSLSLLIAAFLAWLFFNFLVVPREERDLEARFGDSYLEYKKRVPRWLGKV
jgi:protein-S-isoprenylcysteine O-methyltransferase Ste14